MYENTMKRRFKAAFLVLSVTVISFMFWSFTASSHWVWPMVGPNNTPSRYGELKGRETLLETQAGQGHSCYPGLFEPTSDCGQVHRSAESKSGQRPVQHLFFLKTHKTGSRTLATVFNRYALTHNLTVVMRRDLEHLAAERKMDWINDFRPVPPDLGHYDFFTDHARFNETCVRHFLPNDTVFISIVREPFDNFVSACFFSWRFTTHIPGPDPILTYLSNMSRWDPKPGQGLTHSIMSFDFGVDFDSMRTPGYLRNYLGYLSGVFDLVMVTSKFDESLVLLKRQLSWRLQEILYVRMNVGENRKEYSFTAKQIADFKKRRREEYALYYYFLRILKQKLAAQDATFPAEVAVFKSMRDKVDTFCGKASQTEDLLVEATDFSDPFRVSLKDCRLLTSEMTSPRASWFHRRMLQRIGKKL